MKRNIQCLAVDDEPLSLEKLTSYISRIPGFDLVASCEDAIEAMRVMNERDVDALFIDINMPDLNGLDFVRSLDKKPMVVFATAYAQYAADSFSVAPVDYLLKPFGFADFQRAAGRVMRQFELQEQQNDAADKSPKTLYIKVEYRYVRVELSSILYIEGMSDYLRIYIENEPKPLITHSTIRQIKDMLTPNFLQVHRSFVVNMDKPIEIERQRIRMNRDTWIPVGGIFKDPFANYLKSRAIGGREKKGSASNDVD